MHKYICIYIKAVSSENFIQVDQYGHTQKCPPKQKFNVIYIYIYVFMCYICRGRGEYISTNIYAYISRLYPVRISYRLTGMSTPTYVPKKQKVKLLTLACLFLKRKLNYSNNNKNGKIIFSF